MKKKYIVPLIGLIVLIVGLWAAALLVRQRQNLQNKAAVPGGQATLILSPSAVTKYPGDVFPATIKFNTKTYSISSVSFRLSYSFTGATPELEVTDSNGNVSNQIYPDSTLISTGDWTFPVKSVTRANGKVIIDFAAINTNVTGYNNNSDTVIATIYFKVNRAYASNPLVLSFDPNYSQILTKNAPVSSPTGGPADILILSPNNFYTLANDTTAPSSITNFSTSNVSSSSVTLNWTAPADIGPTGKANSYDIRYSTSPITAANFNSLSTPPQLTNSAPGNAGTAETATTSGLTAGNTYYFAIKSSDAANNISNISNVAIAAIINPCTLNNPAITSPNTSQIGRAGLALNYTINIQNKNTGTNCPDDTFTISAQSPANFTVQTSSTVTISTGATTPVTLAINPLSFVNSQTYFIPVNIFRGSTQVGSITLNYIVNNVMIGPKFKLQGVTTSGVDSSNVTDVTLKSTTGVFISGFASKYTSGQNGIFTSVSGLPSDRPSLVAGTYDISIKEPTHLRKAIKGVNLNYGSNIVDWTATPLMAGDFNNDNMINISDIALILSKYTSLSIPVDSSNGIYDVNSDNKIDIIDIAVVLSNYTQLSVSGDQ